MLHGRKVQERKTQDSFIGTKCFVKANNDISLGQRFMKSLNEFKIKRWGLKVCNLKNVIHDKNVIKL